MVNMVAKLAVSIAKFQAWYAMTSIAWVSHEKGPDKKHTKINISKAYNITESGPKGSFVSTTVKMETFMHLSNCS